MEESLILKEPELTAMVVPGGLPLAERVTLMDELFTEKLATPGTFANVAVEPAETPALAEPVLLTDRAWRE